MNIQQLLQLNKMKATFTKNHPMMGKYFKKIQQVGIEEGDVIEIVLKKNDGESYPANIKVKQSDLELLNQVMDFGN